MSTITLNAATHSAFASAPRRAPEIIARLRAAMPTQPRRDAAIDGAISVTVRFLLALVPVSALAWLFVAV